MKTFHACAAAALFLGATALAQQPADGKKKPPAVPSQVESPVHGMVLGKKLTDKEILPPKKTLETLVRREKAASADAWIAANRAELLNRAITSALAARYVQEHHLDATESEIDEFVRGSGPESRDKDWPKEAERQRMRAESVKLREALKAKDLGDAERKEMEENLAFQVRIQDLTEEEMRKEWPKITREMQGKIGAWFVTTWKMNRALFKQYGGRIIFQQAGIEPIDAMRKWLEDSEKAGDFAIYDPAMKEPFWAYFKRDHPSTIKEPTGHEFDKPWWLERKGK